MSAVVTVVGVVVRELYAPGSKSERVATLLVTDAGGQRYLLRRPGADPYVDAELDALLGRRVEVEGRVHRDVLLVERWWLR